MFTNLLFTKKLCRTRYVTTVTGDAKYFPQSFAGRRIFAICNFADSNYFEQLRMCAQMTVGKIWHLAQKSKQRSTFVHDRSVCKMDVAGVTELEKELVDRINSSGIDKLR